MGKIKNLLSEDWNVPDDSDWEYQVYDTALIAAKAALRKVKAGYNLSASDIAALSQELFTAADELEEGLKVAWGPDPEHSSLCVATDWELVPMCRAIARRLARQASCQTEAKEEL